MNAFYTFPTAFGASSPDSAYNFAPAPLASPDYTSTYNMPSSLVRSEFDMLEHAQHTYSRHNNYNLVHTSTSSIVHPTSSGPDFDFARSLRSVRSTMSSPQGQGRGDHGGGRREAQCPTESEAAVAETIVRARKSWKTVKGRSEPVWPPHLETALVQALLQYKPHDSRYARALGRFPKRNRYISDFIFAATGVRRTPKQVGSRLQQLKDVTCGKMLLNHVAQWSLSPPSTANSSVGVASASASPPSHHPDLNVVINGVHGDGSEGSQSPVSPLGGPGPDFVPSSAAQATLLDPYAAHVGHASSQGNWFTYDQYQYVPPPSRL